MEREVSQINGVNKLQRVLDGEYIGHSPSALIADVIHFAEQRGLNFDDILRQGRAVARREREVIVKQFGTHIYAPLPQERRSDRR